MKLAEILKNCIHRLYREGLTTASGGNISMKEELGNIWISPSQIDKGFLTEEDFACVNADGDMMNSNKPSMEFPFHQAIYKKYPEVNAICHLHSPVLVALSLLIPDHKLFESLKKFNCAFAEYAIPGSEQLGENICKAFEEQPELVIMQNHGAIATGKSIGEAAEKIRKLSVLIQQYFKIDDSLFYALSDKSFDLEFEDSRDFYKSRAKHFLNFDDKLEIFANESGKGFWADLKLKSLKKLQDTGVEFNCEIIPESYLLLNQMVAIKEDGLVLVEGESLFNLYDRMEVLDFTAKVILLANKMGKINLMNDDQIQELEEKFCV